MDFQRVTGYQRRRRAQFQAVAIRTAQHTMQIRRCGTAIELQGQRAILARLAASLMTGVGDHQRPRAVGREIVPAQHRDALQLGWHHLHATFALQHVDRSKRIADIARERFLADGKALSAQTEIGIGLVCHEPAGRPCAFLPGFGRSEQQRHGAGASAQFLFDAIAIAAEVGQVETCRKRTVTTQLVPFADKARIPAKVCRIIRGTGMQGRRNGQHSGQTLQESALVVRRLHCVRSARTRKAGLK